MDPGLAFGLGLRIARKDAGLTQEQLANAADVDRTFVSMIERGERQPIIRVLFKVAEALGVSPGSLIDQTEQRTKLDQ